MTEKCFEAAPTEPGIAVRDPWEPIVFRKHEIDAEIARLASLPAGTRRTSAFVHPRSAAGIPALAPGIRVTLDVLLPGERSVAVRENATSVQFCLEGSGTATAGLRSHAFNRWDVWNMPAYQQYWHVNDADEVQVRLCYSNAPVLQHLNVWLAEASSVTEDESTTSNDEPHREQDKGSGVAVARVELDGSGAWLMPYEQLINPPVLASGSLHWPWLTVQEHLDQLERLGSDYQGRRLYLLYNPITGRTNGTTPNFFATITRRPTGIVDRPHRHVSAAINYIMHGSGHSRIGGHQYTWEAGDLMFTAPGWIVHNHASNDVEHVYELTIQDQPFHLACESLLWQEDLRVPPRLLGTEPGFQTNRLQIGVH